MSFNKKFLTVPAILAAICVASGGLIGAIHFGTSAYQAAHKSTEAPKEIKALYTDASYTFGEVEGFTPVSSTEANFRVTITACYTAVTFRALSFDLRVIIAYKPVSSQSVNVRGDAIITLTSSCNTDVHIPVRIRLLMCAIVNAHGLHFARIGHLIVNLGLGVNVS